jgi:CBS domain-containing protein
MNVSEIMSRNVKTIKPDAPLLEAARKMRDENIGAIPVCEGDRVIGMLTDRDIAVRAAAESKDLSRTAVREVMSSDVLTCNENDDVDSITQLMTDRHVHRIPVMGHGDKLVGILSLI